MGEGEGEGEGDGNPEKGDGKSVGGGNREGGIRDYQQFIDLQIIWQCFLIIRNMNSTKPLRKGWDREYDREAQTHTLYTSQRKLLVSGAVSQTLEFTIRRP